MSLVNDKQKKVENRPEQMSYRKCSSDLPWRGSAWLLVAASRFAYQPPRRPVLQALPPWRAVYWSPRRAEGDFWSWRKASGFDVGSSGRHGFECGIDMKRTRTDFPAHRAFEHCLWRAGPFLRPQLPARFEATKVCLRPISPSLSPLTTAEDTTAWPVRSPDTLSKIKQAL